MDPLTALYSFALARKMAALVHQAAALVAFYRMLNTNPTASVEDLEVEKKRMDDELYAKLSQIAPSKGSAELSLKEALLYFAEQL